MEGNIILHKENVPFEMVAKALINDDSIDALTLGIYVKILGLNKEKWNLNINGLAAKLKLSVPKIKTAFALLERTGYLRRVHAKNDAGRYVGYDYHIGNVPFPEDQRTDVVSECSSNTKNQPIEKPAAGKTSGWKNEQLEKPAAGKSGGIIIDPKENNKPQKEIHTPNNTPIPPTVEQVEDYARSKGFADPRGFAEYYIAYQTENGWQTGKGKNRKPIDNWKLNVLSWLPNHKTQVFPKSKGRAAEIPLEHFNSMFQ